jgi:hypothetical protein
MAENMRKLREEAADAEQCQRDSVKALAEAKETASRTWTEAEETALAEAAASTEAKKIGDYAERLEVLAEKAVQADHASGGEVAAKQLRAAAIEAAAEFRAAGKTALQVQSANDAAIRAEKVCVRGCPPPRRPASPVACPLRSSPPLPSPPNPAPLLALRALEATWRSSSR